MSWRICHPSEIPRSEWLARLDTIPNASPYLLPEWSQFWADVWPGAKAEVYDDGNVLIPVVRRGRYGFNWRFAQPFGTDCIIGEQEAIDWDSLLRTICGGRVIEAAITAKVLPAMNGWRRHELTQTRWIIKTEGQSYQEFSRAFADSHRRNIAKGNELNLRIDTSPDFAAIARLWQDRHRAPRFMLNAAHANALVRRFGVVNAIRCFAVWAGPRPVAGVMYLVHKNVAVYLDPIVNRDTRFRGSGHTLIAHSLRSLLESGVTHVDLGGSPGGNDSPGLDQFKSGWNATQDTIHTTLYRRNWYSILSSLR